MYKVLTVFGTRPEAIKMIPIIQEFKKYSNIIESKVCTTGQHKEILNQILATFEIIPDFDLDIMRKDQSLADISARILTTLSPILQEYNPNLILVHGDTATTLNAALAAFYLKIPIIHVEAGLRTHDILSPWPEEANRKLTSIITDLHMAPTAIARQNLLDENISNEKIFLTGNTVIDALFLAIQKIKSPSIANEIHKNFSFIEQYNKIILVTAHRRENHQTGIYNIAMAVKTLANLYPENCFILPVHPNPNVKAVLIKYLTDIPNIYLISPLDYLSFAYIMDKSYLILTDSGGIQEEAPALNKPVLVMRSDTERPEAIEAGTARLVGTVTNTIIEATKSLIEDKEIYHSMSSARNPYGDGTAATKIVNIIIEYLNNMGVN